MMALILPTSFVFAVPLLTFDLSIKNFGTTLLRVSHLARSAAIAGTRQAMVGGNAPGPSGRCVPRSSSCSLAMFGGLRRDSASWPPNSATQRYVGNRGKSGNARLALETTFMTPQRHR
jgi:hypothetical protein